MKKKIISAIFLSGIGVLLLLVIIAGAIGAIITIIGGEESSSGDAIGVILPINAEVEAYREQITNELGKYDKEEYIDLYLAVVMQESAGKDLDIFQIHKYLYYLTDEFENIAKSDIISTSQSIQVGVWYLDKVLDEAGVKAINDIDNIKKALLEYNLCSNIKQNTDESTQYSVGMWYQKYMDYTDYDYPVKVLRYYQLASEGQTYVEAGEAAEVQIENRIAWLFPNGLPETQEEMEEKYLTIIDVAILNERGEESSMKLKVHKKLAPEIKIIFEEMKEINFKIRTWDTAAYNWRYMRNNEEQLSYHSYGSCVDINWESNAAPYTSGTYLPGEDEFAVTEEIVNIWKAHGFYWGGDWEGNSFDPMHFTYSNN